MNFTITGYSTALFSTWYFIEELGLLFDAGDGVTSSLLQKARKINNVFISHADRDHLTGLLQFNQLNAREGFPVIHYPKDCRSFPAMAEFSAKFDPHVGGTVWKSLAENEEVKIKDDIIIQAIKSNHVSAAEGIYKSFGFKVFQTKTKLKPEFVNLPQQQIRELMEKRDRSELTTEIKTNLLT
jgi:ribonuclease Z